MKSLKRGQTIIPEGYLPTACFDSEYFSTADLVLDLEKNHPQGLYSLIASTNTSDHPVFLHQHSYLNPHEPPQQTTIAKVLKLTLDLSPLLPTINAKVKPPTIYIVSTAANHALTIGRFIVNKKDQIVFQLPRFSIEPAIQTDMSTAINQAFHVPEILHRVIEDLGNPVQEAFLTYLTREGHLTHVQQAIFNNSGHHVPYTIANISHLKSEDLINEGYQFHSIFNRVSLIYPINFEGLNSSQVKTLFLGDQIASGMQIVDLANYIVDQVAKENKNHGINHLVVVAPLSSIFGIATISLWGAKNGIKTTFIASSSLLDSGPNKYYSPLSQNEKVAPIPFMQVIHHLGHPENVRGKMCVGCNWTARFGASPETALRDSQREAKQKNTTNQALIQHAAGQTDAILDLLQKNHLPRTTLVPESSRFKAWVENKLDILNEFIENDPVKN